MDFCKICFLGGVKFEGYGDDYEMVNMEFICDYCQGLIIGWRMNCNVCDDFDFCYGCYVVKKYFYGYLFIYSIMVYLMVIIWISDWQRFIQLYIYNYFWLFFVVLVFYSVYLISVEDVDGEKLDFQICSSVIILWSQCMQFVGDCLMKVYQGKGFKVLVLFGILLDGDLILEDQVLLVIVFI